MASSSALKRRHLSSFQKAEVYLRIQELQEREYLIGDSKSPFKKHSGVVKLSKQLGISTETIKNVERIKETAKKKPNDKKLQKQMGSII